MLHGRSRLLVVFVALLAPGLLAGGLASETNSDRNTGSSSSTPASTAAQESTNTKPLRLIDSSRGRGRSEESDNAGNPSSRGVTEDTLHALQIDTAKVECPVGPKHGDATIRIDSTSADWSVKVEPDSHLVTEYKDRWGSKWKFYGLETTAHVNDDDHLDLTVNVGTTVISKNVNLYTDIFVGCGGNRYAVVGKRLLFDRFGSWDDGEEKWKTVYTKHDMEGRDPPLTYTKRYRFYREQEEYRIVPGSVWYTKRSADRLGFDYEDRPSCPAGSRLPVKLKPAGDGEKLSEGDRVKRKPFSKKNLYVYWVGDLNNDEKSDLVLERREGGSRTAKTLYSGCGKSFYSDLYFDISKSMKPIKNHKRGESYIWRHIEESEIKNGKTDTVVFKWDDYRR